MKGLTLSLSHVQRQYIRGQEKVDALRDISMTLYPGQVTLILGPSGGGKSSLLHVLGGMDRPTSGKITAGSLDITDLKPDQLARWRGHNIGFVFQGFYLLPGQTAVDNAALPLLLDGQSPARRRDRARNLLTTLGLGDRLNHRPSELSGGQIQRVAIARALAQDPPIILADEPTGNLDTRSGQDIMSQLQRLAHDDGRTVIVVSHNEEYVSLADRVIRVRDGIIASDSLDGTPQTVDVSQNNDARTAQGKPGLLSLAAESLRSLRRRKFRSLLTSLGVTIGVTSMVLLVSIGAGLQSHIVHSILSATSLNAMTVTPNKAPVGLSFSPQVTSGKSHPITDSTIKGFKKIPHVRTAYGASSFLTHVHVGKNSSALVLAALPPSSFAGGSRPKLLAGSYPTHAKPGIVLPESTATTLLGISAHHLNRAIGKTITIRVTSTMGAGGTLGANANLTAVRLSVRAVMSNSLGQFGYVNYGTGQHWLSALAHGHKVTYLNATVYATSTQYVKSIASHIQRQGYGVTTTQSIIKKVQGGFGVVEAGLGVVGGIALAVAGLMIGVVMSMAVLERRREIGIWRAVGARRRDIFTLFLIEAVVMGLMGGLLGDLLGWGIGSAGAHLLHHPDLFLVPPWLIGLGLAFGGGIAALAGVVPANHAARLNPVDALKTE